MLRFEVSPDLSGESIPEKQFAGEFSLALVGRGQIDATTTDRFIKYANKGNDASLVETEATELSEDF